jgi:hypothetical protein
METHKNKRRCGEKNRIRISLNLVDKGTYNGGTCEKQNLTLRNFKKS